MYCGKKSMRAFSSQAEKNSWRPCVRSQSRMGGSLTDVLEDAMRNYIEAHTQQKVRPTVMAHFQASLEKNRELGKLLAE